MDIYFAASITGGRADTDIYSQIIEYLKKRGRVLTEHCGDKKLSAMGEATLTAQEIHDRDLEWLLAAPAMVAEVSTISFGVGYEIGVAVSHEKEILALYRPQAGKRLSAMIAGSPRVSVVQYKTLDEATRAIDIYLESIVNKAHTK